MNSTGSDADEWITQHWTGSKIVTSYLISITGSYCTIQLMEQWRRADESKNKFVLLVLSAIALGGCGIWSMHFTGMTALELRLDDGSVLEIDYELGFTVLSFVFAVVGVLVGLKIASSDPYFLEMQGERRKKMLASNLKNVKMAVVVKKSAVARRIKLIALFSRLWLILLGGAFAALGVLGMHYLGMMAQRTNADMHFNHGVVIASALIAFFTANAAFWILFRALTFLPDSELLRLGSALIMGVAVCATHYCGMGAATYSISSENYATTARFVMDGKGAAEGASNGALLTCYWLASFSVVRSVRRAEMTLARTGDHTMSTAHDAKMSQNPHSVSRAASDRGGRGTGGANRKVHVTVAVPAETQV